MAFSTPISNNPYPTPYRPPLTTTVLSRFPSITPIASSPTFTVSPTPPSPPPMMAPTTRKNLHLLPESHDQILYLTPWQKLQLGLRNTFIETPRQVMLGLRGDSESTGAHLLNIANIPYYLGGAFLAGSFAAGGDRRAFAQQATGVTFYYLGLMASNLGINALCKSTSGVDLDLRYKSSDGDIRKVFASLDFPRFDVLENPTYDKIAEKLHIPGNIADSHQEVRRRSREIASDANTNKLLLGNLLAAVGAGWMARRIPWARLMPHDIGRDLDRVWRYRSADLTEKFAQSAHILLEVFRTVVGATVTGYPGEKDPALRRAVLGALGAMSGWIGFDIVHTAHASSHDYQAPQADRLAPELRQKPVEGLASATSASPDAFTHFEDAEMDNLAKTRGGAVL